MIDTTITLIMETVTKNAYGAPVSTKSEREIFCKCKSVTSSEFYNGQQAGLSLAYVFETNPINYQGEKELIYDGEVYSIIRTYRANLDTLELHAGLKVGDRIAGSDSTGE